MRTTADVTFGEGRNAFGGTDVTMRGLPYTCVATERMPILPGLAVISSPTSLLYHDHQRRRLVGCLQETADDRGRGVVGEVGDDLVCGRRSHKTFDLDRPRVAFHDLDVIAVGEFLAEREG